MWRRTCATWLDANQLPFEFSEWMYYNNIKNNVFHRKDCWRLHLIGKDNSGWSKEFNYKEKISGEGDRDEDNYYHSSLLFRGAT